MSRTVFPTIPLYLELLGFDYKYKVKVTEDPKATNEGYEYKVKLISKQLKWYGGIKTRSAFWKIGNLIKRRCS